MLRSAIPNFSLVALTTAQTKPKSPIAPTTVTASVSTSFAASTQSRRPVTARPARIATTITASIERRPSFSQ